MTDINELIERQPKGHSLLQEFYNDPELYRHDLDRVHLSHWICAGHVGRVPDRGDYFVFEIGPESIIIVRDRDGEVHALANVCRHRGSHVTYEKEGNCRAFVCPYHGWSYHLDGSLMKARLTKGELDAALYGLKQLHLRVIEGIIFVCCADEPPDLSEAEEIAHQSIGRYGWASAKVAHRATYTVSANWKLTTENYMECYHCGPAHPEFSLCHASARPHEDNDELRAKVDRRARAMGIVIPEVDHWPWSNHSNGEGVSCYHDAAVEGSITGSDDGKAVAPLMGDFTDYDGGFVYVEIGPASFFLAYPDHGVIYRFVPVAVDKTAMEVIWLVRGDAREGEDYDLARLTWMWDVTSIADKTIIDHNQLGVNSRYYEPGPYHPMEVQARQFTEWYLQAIGE
jgi:phenylpropionate dioxygenase-like ring-hydroxylating dioxygenase large terminal subunit